MSKVHKDYSFKITPKYFTAMGGVMLFIGAVVFVGFYSLIYIGDFTPDTYVFGFTACFAILLGIFCVWFGAAERVYVYDKKLVCRNMLFKYTTLYYSEIKYYIHRIHFNTIYFYGTDMQRIKLFRMAISNTYELVEILNYHSVQKQEDYSTVLYKPQIFEQQGGNGNTESYTNEEIVACQPKIRILG